MSRKKLLSFLVSCSLMMSISGGAVAFADDDVSQSYSESEGASVSVSDYVHQYSSGTSESISDFSVPEELRQQNVSNGETSDGSNLKFFGFYNNSSSETQAPSGASSGIGLNPSAGSDSVGYSESYSNDDGSESSFVSVLGNENSIRNTIGNTVFGFSDEESVSSYLSEYRVNSVGDDWVGMKSVSEMADIMTAAENNGFFSGADTMMSWETEDAYWTGHTSSSCQGYASDGAFFRENIIYGNFSSADAIANTSVTSSSMDNSFYANGTIDYNFRGRKFTGYVIGDSSDGSLSNYSAQFTDSDRFIISFDYVVNGSNVTGRYLVEDAYLFDTSSGEFNYINDEPNIVHDIDDVVRGLHMAESLT